MFYPKEFKKRVKEVYPDCEELHRKLDFGDDFKWMAKAWKRTAYLLMDKMKKAVKIHLEYLLLFYCNPYNRWYEIKDVDTVKL